MTPITPMNVIQIAGAYRGRDIPEAVKRDLTFIESALLTDPFPAEFSERVGGCLREASGLRTWMHGWNT